MIVKLSHKNQSTFYTGKVTYSLLEEAVKENIDSVKNA